MTSPGTTVDLDSHASGTWVVTVRQETNLVSHDRMIQLLRNSEPRIGITRQDLKQTNHDSDDYQPYFHDSQSTRSRSIDGALSLWLFN